MGKYLMLWELDQTKIPIDPKERGAAWSIFMAMIRKDFEKGVNKDWGAFVGESNGYTITEGTEVEITNSLQQYVPFCIFKAYPIATEGQENDRIKALTGYSMETSNTGEKQLKTNPYDSHPNPG